VASKDSDPVMRTHEVKGVFTIARDSQLPLYQQVKAAILAQIEAGVWAIGQRIPSEEQLVQATGVSRITVRQALRELGHEGHLTRVPSKGTFVSAPRKAEPLTALTSFSENMRAQGLAPGYRTLHIGLRPPDEEVRKGLGLLPDTSALLLERLLLADGEPIAIQRAWIPESLVAAHLFLFTQQVLDTTSFYTVLERAVGVRLWRASETIDPALAERDEARLLGIPTGALLLSIHRQTVDTDGRPVEDTRLIFRADRYRYRVSLLRTPAEVETAAPTIHEHAVRPSA